ncbi:hypothetical protein [Microvirga massiliensis]|uniref:hypothetical protein n=1 Tax=Microvirga massiliensis TaxID=1033741 RepID=UPI00062B384B|nr:hypothetical protein [Microvirga massiliensis]
MKAANKSGLNFNSISCHSTPNPQVLVRLGRDLREVYRNLIWEPLPESFGIALHRLSSQEETGRIARVAAETHSR